MKRATRAFLILLTWPVLSGCGVTLGPTAERLTVWAKMGTPCRIVDERRLDVLVPDGQGGWTRSTANLCGMCALDEPTLEYYRQLDQAAPEEGR
jgi:hypothetical protein